MNYSIDEIEKFISGDFDTNSYINFLIDFGKHYPVDISDLLFVDYDTDKGEPIYEPFKTGGYGHKINEGEHNPNITGEQFNYTKAYWEDVFEKDFNIALTGTRKLVDESKTHPIAFGILVEMAYQMGVDGTSKFEKTLEFVKNGEYEKAGDEMLDSKWARQTNTRATTLSDLMKSVQNKVH